MKRLRPAALMVADGLSGAVRALFGEFLKELGKLFAQNAREWLLSLFQ